MTYRFKVDNDYLSQTKYYGGVSGNKNVYMCEFEISCEEKGAVWFAVFKKGDEAYITPILDGKCNFPYECLEEPCTVYLGCYAECGEDKRISTNWLSLKVDEGAYSQGTAPTPPSKDLWETLLSNSVPVIGENGNWFTYDMTEETYVDTGFVARGEQGPQGIQGPKGDKGDKGDTGDRGPQGIQGEQGLKGDKGDTGDTGPQGIQGEKGVQGEKGETGPQGIQGEQGPKGDKGDRGIQGPKGDQGVQGPKGDNGATQDVLQNNSSVLDGNGIAHIDAYTKEQVLSVLCPQTETTDTVITDAIEHDAIDYTIYGDTGGVGDEVTIEGETKYEIPITVKGKNLVKIYGRSQNTSWGNSYSPNTSPRKFPDEIFGEYILGMNANNYYLPSNISNLSIHSDSSVTFISANISYGVGFPIKLKANTTYFTPKSNSDNIAVALYTNSDDNNYTFSRILTPGNQTTFTTNSNETVGIVVVKVQGKNVEETISNIFMEEYHSNLRSPYELYHNSQEISIYLDSQLFENDSVSLSDPRLNLPQIKLYKGTNIIEFGTTVQPSSVKFEYYQDINKVIANLQALILSQ